MLAYIAIFKTVMYIVNTNNFGLLRCCIFFVFANKVLYVHGNGNFSSSGNDVFVEVVGNKCACSKGFGTSALLIRKS